MIVVRPVGARQRPAVPKPEDDFLRRVAKRIVVERRAARMTQEQLAELLGTATRNVQRIESGAQNLTLITLSRVARALRVRPEQLIAGC
jgi:transcriptional regulator with XRE-family HTH domain